jgi:hypothetical protein
VNDKVLLEGLDIEGLGTGLDGIKVLAVGNLTVRKCSIRNFSQNGIEFATSAASRGFIEDSQILGNVGGVALNPSAGSVGVFIERTLVDKNSSFATKLNSLSTILANSSTFTGSPTAILYNGGGTFTSTGTNLLIGTGAPNASTPLK